MGQKVWVACWGHDIKGVFTTSQAADLYLVGLIMQKYNLLPDAFYVYTFILNEPRTNNVEE